MKQNDEKKSVGEEPVRIGFLCEGDKTYALYTGKNGDFMVPVSAMPPPTVVKLPHAGETDFEQYLPVPPLQARYIAYLLLSKKQRLLLLGDLDEEYPEVCSLFGQRKADIWYWKGVTGSLMPFLIQCIGRLIQWHHMAK